VTPNSNHGPAGFLQSIVRVAVTGDVGFDFRPPPLGVVLGPGAMLRTPVPEAPVEKNGNALAREYDIGGASSSLNNLSMDSKSQSAPV
jgi:hypothetical protein